MVKKLPASASEGDVRGEVSIPGSGGPSGGETATRSSILGWRVHGQRSLAGYSPWLAESRTELKRLSTHASLSMWVCFSFIDELICVVF